MALHHALGEAQLAAKRPDLVLEELAQRLHQFEAHAGRQAADIVVALDGDAGPAAEGDALDDIGIEGALGQEIGTAQALRLLLEDVDEEAADDLALLFRVGHAGERAEEE